MCCGFNCWWMEPIGGEEGYFPFVKFNLCIIMNTAGEAAMELRPCASCVTSSLSSIRSRIPQTRCQRAKKKRGNITAKDPLFFQLGTLSHISRGSAPGHLLDVNTFVLQTEGVHKFGRCVIHPSTQRSASISSFHVIQYPGQSSKNVEKRSPFLHTLLRQPSNR